VDHVWITKKRNVEEEEDHFLCSMVKEEEKARLRYSEGLVGENHVIFRSTKNIWRVKVKDFECVLRYFKKLYLTFWMCDVSSSFHKILQRFMFFGLPFS
jgi:hypothetical protein